MNRTLGIHLIIYSVLVLALAALVYGTGTSFSRPGAIAGAVGGFLSIVWGIRAIAGKQGKALPILTLVPVTFVLLSHSINLIWEGTATRNLTGTGLDSALLIGMLVLSVGMLFRIAWAGQFAPSQSSPATSNPKDHAEHPHNSEEVSLHKMRRTGH